MRVLFVGDVYGRPGKQIASVFIPEIVREREVDFVITNGENCAGGFGITFTSAEKLFSYGVDVLTTGNHVWDRSEVYDVFQKYPRIVRPANFPSGTPGKGYIVTQSKDGIKIAVINLQGRIFLPPIDCPFHVVDTILESIKGETNIIIVDFHAEATAEKMAMGWYLDGRVSAVLGTHTHIMTADERILPKGTAYITDAGMTGPHDSVIGVKTEQSIARIIKQLPVRFSPATEGLEFNGVLVDIDEETGMALSIETIKERRDE